MTTLHPMLLNMLALSRDCAAAIMGRLHALETYTLDATGKCESLFRRALLREFRGVNRIDDTTLGETTVPSGQFLLYSGISGRHLLDADMRLPSGHPPQGFGTAFCVFENQVPTVAVVHQMSRNQLYYATTGGGCYRLHGDFYRRFMAGENLDGEPFNVASSVAPLVTDATGPFVLAMPQVGILQTAPALNAYTKLRRDLGKKALLLEECDHGCPVANAIAVMQSRNAACYYALGRLASETAAASLCLTEAGGVATDIKGSPLQWPTFSNTVFWAKSPAVADCLLAKPKKPKAAPKPRPTRKKKEAT